MCRLLKSIFNKGLILALTVMVAACDSDSPSTDTMANNDEQPKVVLAGSTFAHPFFKKVLDVYMSKHADVIFSYHSIGSGAGIEEFIEGTADVGTTDVPLNDLELSRLNEDIDQIIVTSGMISIAYNIDGVTGTLRLPRDVYPDIFLGKINRWDDPRIVEANPDIKLPAKFIQVVARSDSSGTTYAFTNHLSAISPEWESGLGAAKKIDWPGATMKASGNEGVAQRLAITKNSIGYVEYGFANRLGLTIAQLENNSGVFLSPNIEAGDKALADSISSLSNRQIMASISDPVGASSYPIVAYTWALVRKEYDSLDKTQSIRALIKWTLNEGQAEAKPLFYLPLSADIVKAGESQL